MYPYVWKNRRSVMAQWNKVTEYTFLLLLSVTPICVAHEEVHTNGIETLQLEVGQTLVRHFSGAKTLQISRKGLLDLVFLEEQKWQITALKPGFLILTVLQAHETVSARLHIEILTKPKVKTETQTQWFSLCERAQLHCEAQTGVISGSTDSFLHHWNLQAICREEKICLYGGHLSKKGLEAWQVFVARELHSPFAYEITPSGALQFSFDCLSSEEWQQKKSMVEIWVQQQFPFLPPPLVLCRSWQSHLYYRMTFKALLMEKAIAKELGFENKIQGRVFPTVPSFETRFHDFLHDRKVQIIAEPMIRLNAGITAHAQSGGEFPILARKTQGEGQEIVEPTWKEHGIKLEVTALPVSKDHAILRYDFSLKNPTSEGVNHMQIQRLTSELDVKIGVPFIVGQIDFASDGSRNQSISLLRSIPIMGPFFKMEFFDKAQTNLYLWLRLDPDISPELREEFLPTAAPITS
jgi:hypothetical protein